MKKQNLDLSKMGFSSMTDSEMIHVAGGGILKWIFGAAGAIIGFLIGGPGGAWEGGLLGFACGCAADAYNALPPAVKARLEQT